MKKPFTLQSVASLSVALAVGALVCMPQNANAQLSVAAVSTPYTITFDATLAGVSNGTFAGSGFQATPAAGQLDSDAWASTGMSDTPALAFGGTKTTGDYARGASTGGVTTGGFYGFTVATSDRALGIQPGGSDWTPGDLTLRVQNNTGSTLTSMDVAYEVWELNNEARSNSFNFEWSTDNVSFTSVGALDFTSTAAAAGSPVWIQNDRSTTLTGLTLTNGSYIYLRWFGDDVGGSVGRDEFAIDDISVTGYAGTNTSVEFVSTSSSVAENAGTTNLALAITNFSASVATNVTITATGATGRVTSHTSPVVFPANSGSNENCVVTLNNNSICDTDEDVTYTITAVTGGQGTPIIGTNSAHVLTVQNEDLCTSVELTATSSTVSEGVGTMTITGSITDFSTSVATTVDLVLLSGDATRINNYTTQTLTFPANDGSDQSITITVTDNGLCDGTEVLNFQLQNIGGGQGTPFIGAADQYTLTVTDNEGTLGELIANQAFDGLSSDDWTIDAGSGNISTATGGTDTPANERILSGTASWLVNNAAATLDLATVDVSGYSNIVITARVSSTSATGGNGADNGDIMDFFVDRDGAGFPGTADIRIEGNGNSRWGYSTGTGVASTTAGTPAAFQPTAGGNQTTEGYTFISISVPDGTNTIALRVEGDNNSTSEFWNLDNVQVTGDRCNTIYYSRGTGNVGDAIWSLNPVGTGVTVTFDRFKSAVVQTGHVVTVDANTRVEDLTVNAGGTLALSANTLTVNGDADFTGTLTASDNSTLTMLGSSGVVLTSTSALDLFNLTANVPGDLLSDATIAIRGTLLLEDGDFDISTGALTLSSTATGTGRLGPVNAGASYTGDMTVQRYIPAGATNWRLLGSPVAGQTVNEWKDDFYTAGFPGSHSPGFSNPVGSGILWPSIRWYDETNTFASADSGLVGATSTAQSLAQGQGFAAWCGDGLTTTTAFTIDVTGAPIVASSPINLPLDYTNTGNAGIDGYNLCSNPLPSPILFSNIARTNVDDNVTFFNPASGYGNAAVWDISLNIGTNNATDTIQSSQGFYLKANAAAPVAQIEEADKVVGNNGGLFGGAQVSTFNGVRLKVSSAINNFRDETVIVFNAGTADRDGEDVGKVVFGHPDAPQIATRTPDGAWIAINAFGEYTSDIAIPVVVDVAISGTYTITASSTENIGLSCLVLEDMTTGTMTPMIEGATYSFSMDATDDANAERFVLHASAPVVLYADATRCHGDANGVGTVVYGGTGPMDITWTNGIGEVLYEQTISEGIGSISDLAAGEYGVQVSSTSACGSLSTTFRIEEPAAMEALAEVTDANCPNDNGSVAVTLLGGTAPFSYLWSNGSTEATLTAAAGEYDLEVTDANGCVQQAAGFEIGSGVGPTAAGGSDVTTVLVNLDVLFTNDTDNADEYTWDFGDGNTSTEMEPTHSWTIPGTYTVTLTASDGSCTDTWTTEITVETTISINDVPVATNLNAWYANDKFVVEHGFNNGKPVTIDVMDATGRLHATRQIAGTPARVNIASEGLSTGIWFVRITNEQVQRTFRVPLVR